jgi:hypothetical protein
METAEARFDFPAISDDGKQNPRPGDGWEERVHEAADDGWTKGAQIGSVALAASSEEGKGPPYVTAKFTFRDGDEVTLRGAVPGMGSWVGKGSVEYVEGTGKFAGRTGSLPVEFKNPKRWG